MANLLDSAVITFNTSGGPVELHRGTVGERAVTLAGMMESVNVLLTAGHPVPRAYTLTPEEFDYLLSMKATFTNMAKGND